MPRVAVVGATGYTGTLVTEECVRRGLDVVAVGRNPDKLARLPDAVESRVADATDIDAVRAAIGDSEAVCSCVGPFVDLGEPTLRAAVDAGVHYIDTTGEQAFMRLVFERYADADTAVVPAIGFDYVPGDMAAALAARKLGTRPDEIRIAYAIRGAKASDGTKRTGMRVAALPCLVWEDGSLVEEQIGSREQEFSFPDGDSHVALWPGGEVLTVPRHTGARNVAVYMRMPKVMAKMARAAKLASPLKKAGEKLVGDETSGPDPEQRRKGSYAVVADARHGDRWVRCAVRGQDMYGMTAAACAEALVRMTDGGFDGAGALAPSEAFDPASLLDALNPYLEWTVER